MMTILLLTLTLALAGGPAEVASRNLRVFDADAVASVAGLSSEQAAAALDAAEAELREIARVTDPSSTAEGTLGALNKASGVGPQPVGESLFTLLSRARDFCDWTGGITGPLGFELARVWGRWEPRPTVPGPEEVAAATLSAGCDRLRLDDQQRTVNLAEGSRLDLSPFARGFAVDAAIEALRRSGAPSGFVRIAGVARGFGRGPDNAGWLVEPPAVAGLPAPLEPIRLGSGAYAAATSADPGFTAGNQVLPPYLDQRKGQPGTGVLAVLAVSELAVDAQGLAATLYATGSRDGQRRLGSLKPRPHVLWVLGSGEGEPLLVEYFWSTLRRGGFLQK
ncbi:MAG TPA: FAD:protein FMN transferase [Thermoanaerobaculia bacterium]|nr:FAD:protein FMN transferase [Thermoanaerobaculia bacterium]